MMEESPMVTARFTAWLLAVAAICGTATNTCVAAAGDDPSGSIGRTPPRISLIEGEVSFWRPGAEDWTPGQVNTPLAPGDELYTGHGGNLELQVGNRAFVRAWGDTQVGVANQEPDFLQIKVTAGHVSLDLRTVEQGHTVELDTPNAAFTIERAGYYRVDVAADRTSFITRRAGRATMTPANGQPLAIAASEEVVLEGAQAPTVQSYVAPELDTWDRWNYARTDDLLESISARYVPAGVYGANDLDHHGNWRVVPQYGAIWVPEAVPAGWAPYSTGRWVMDPFYGWTWVDTAPWGWAPYHYGRWVFVDGLWAWAPGPLVARPVYAPALVAFFGAPGVRVGVSVGTPSVSWVALGWGEPLVPWWGRPGFVGQPHWAGWGGPRVVNNVVVNRTTVVNVNTINVYRNVAVQNAVVAVPQERFGRGAPVHEARVAEVDVHQLQAVRGALRVTPAPASFVPSSGAAARPPEAVVSRQVIATRAFAPRPAAFAPGGAAKPAPAVNVPQARIVRIVKDPSASTAAPARPAFGASPVERARPTPPPAFTPREQARVAPSEQARVAPQGPSRPTPPSAPREQKGAPPPPSSAPGAGPRAEPARRALPGEPANRLAPGRGKSSRPEADRGGEGPRGGQRSGSREGEKR
jgi:hypothetical protein